MNITPTLIDIMDLMKQNVECINTYINIYNLICITHDEAEKLELFLDFATINKMPDVWNSRIERFLVQDYICKHGEVYTFDEYLKDYKNFFGEKIILPKDIDSDNGLTIWKWINQDDPANHHRNAYKFAYFFSDTYVNGEWHNECISHGEYEFFYCDTKPVIYGLDGEPCHHAPDKTIYKMKLFASERNYRGYLDRIKDLFDFGFLGGYLEELSILLTNADRILFHSFDAAGLALNIAQSHDVTAFVQPVSSFPFPVYAQKGTICKHCHRLVPSHSNYCPWCQYPMTGSQEKLYLTNIDPNEAPRLCHQCFMPGRFAYKYCQACGEAFT